MDLADRMFLQNSELDLQDAVDLDAAALIRMDLPSGYLCQHGLWPPPALGCTFAEFEAQWTERRWPKWLRPAALQERAAMMSARREMNEAAEALHAMEGAWVPAVADTVEAAFAWATVAAEASDQLMLAMETAYHQYADAVGPRGLPRAP